MAFHPDNVHEGLSKIVQYCEKMVKVYDKDLLYSNSEENDRKDDYFRHFLFMPILLINDDLYEFVDNKLIKVQSSLLVHNYHFEKEPKMAYVFVVTKKGLPPFLKKIRNLEDEIELKMIEAKKGSA